MHGGFVEHRLGKVELSVRVRQQDDRLSPPCSPSRLISYRQPSLFSSKLRRSIRTASQLATSLSNVGFQVLRWQKNWFTRNRPSGSGRSSRRARRSSKSAVPWTNSRVRFR
jgi:hypothetical protein